MLGNELTKYRLPVGPVTEINIAGSSLGPGIVLTMMVNGKREMLAFSSAADVAAYVSMVLTGPTIRQIADEAKPAPKVKAVGRGRPKMTEAEKAERKAARAAKKANGVDKDVPAEKAGEEAALAA